MNANLTDHPSMIDHLRRRVGFIFCVGAIGESIAGTPSPQAAESLLEEMLVNTSSGSVPHAGAACCCRARRCIVKKAGFKAIPSYEQEPASPVYVYV